MNKEYDISNILGSIDFHKNFLQNINGLLLTNHEIEVLERYNIPYKNCNSLKEVLYEVESILDDAEIIDEELELISSSISERDYYQNTNK